jgi:formylmethanofuran dehydrogenase subunit E
MALSNTKECQNDNYCQLYNTSTTGNNVLLLIGVGLSWPCVIFLQSHNKGTRLQIQIMVFLYYHIKEISIYIAQYVQMGNTHAGPLHIIRRSSFESGKISLH